MADRAICPNHINHTEAPKGYLDWGLWAHQMSKTHRQVKCAECGDYLIWVPKQTEAD